MVFGEHREYLGAIAKGGGSTVLSINYPLIVHNVEIRFTVEDKEEIVRLSLSDLAPANLPRDYEISFFVKCDDVPSVEVSFWTYSEIDGRFKKIKIE